MFQPVIKWSGSKRSQASEIIKYFPKEIDTYYEPFCGGCSVCGNVDNTYEVPSDLYSQHLYIKIK